MTFSEQSGKSHLRTLLCDDGDASDHYAGEREQAASLTRRLRQIMDDALASELSELAVPAPRAELLTVVFLE